MRTTHVNFVQLEHLTPLFTNSLVSYALGILTAKGWDCILTGIAAVSNYTLQVYIFFFPLSICNHVVGFKDRDDCI